MFAGKQLDKELLAAYDIAYAARGDNNDNTFRYRSKKMFV